MKFKILTIAIAILFLEKSPGIFGQHQRRNPPPPPPPPPPLPAADQNGKEFPFYENPNELHPSVGNFYHNQKSQQRRQQQRKLEGSGGQRNLQSTKNILRVNDNNNNNNDNNIQPAAVATVGQHRHEFYHHPSPFNHPNQQAGRHRGFDAIHGELVPSCSETNGFSPGQMRLCQLYPDHVSSILQAARLAAEECQFQFSTRRWNCSLLPWGNSSSFLAPPPYMKPGSKEVAILKAFMSSAITYVTARACREGVLSQCTCSRRQKPKDLPEDWVWGGCGDNTEYGFMFGVGFVDSREKEMNHPRHSKELLLMMSNTHNNQVGRRIVVSLSKPGCKCHGVSGSCSLKTCWHQLPTFRMIGYELRSKYDDNSVLVKFNKAGTKLIHSFTERKKVVISEETLRKVSEIQNMKYTKNKAVSSNDVISGNWSAKTDRQIYHLKENREESKAKNSSDVEALPSNRRSIAIKRRVYRQYGKHQKRHPEKQTEASRRLVLTVRRPSKDELVYTSQSTNFCEPSPDGSWSGTQGRPCKRGSGDPDGCDLMCCGRGYNTFRTRTIERCNCQFVWCCHVQCSSCEKFTDVHVCK